MKTKEVRRQIEEISRRCEHDLWVYSVSPHGIASLQCDGCREVVDMLRPAYPFLNGTKIIAAFMQITIIEDCSAGEILDKICPNTKRSA
jgi:hypothetical protein